MRLPGSTSIVTVISQSFTIYEAGTSLTWDDDVKVCIFLSLP